MGAPKADRVSATLAAARAIAPDVLDLTVRLAQIPAPTGDEGERSRFVAGWLREQGHGDIWTDELGDVTVQIPGAGPGAPVLIAAHLDTVFPRQTPLAITRDEGKLRGPGVGDNSLGIAAALLLPAMLARLEVRPAVDMVVALTVGEEGLGNLRGMRAVVDANPAVGAAIALEGHNLGRVTHIAVGSRRLKVRVTGPGGHSWGAYGQPSAIHAIARLIADFDELPTPGSPKTTLNVGLIEGGVSVNTIAPSASCVIDLRSTDEAALRRLAANVDRAVGAAARGGIQTETIVLGERPAGLVPLDSGIVKAATATLKALGIDAICDASSTDANVPISRGIPAVCLGLTSGEHAHREDESIDTEPVPTGLAQVLLLTLQLAEDLATGNEPAPGAA